MIVTHIASRLSKRPNNFPRYRRRAYKRARKYSYPVKLTRWTTNHDGACHPSNYERLKRRFKPTAFESRRILTTHDQTRYIHIYPFLRGLNYAVTARRIRNVEGEETCCNSSRWLGRVAFLLSDSHKLWF